MVCGITRLPVAISVITVELTGDSKYLTPIIITAIISCWVGSPLGGGLYESLMRAKGLSFLNDSPPLTTRFMNASQIMTTEVKWFPSKSNVCNIVHILNNSTHKSYPVISRRTGVKGIVHRKDVLCFLLQKRLVTKERNPQRKSGRIADMVGKFMDHHNTTKLVVCEGCEQETFDLAPYTASVHSVLTHAEYTQVYRLFRDMGIRHLCVTDHDNTLRGVITRKDLLIEEADAGTTKKAQSKHHCSNDCETAACNRVTCDKDVTMTDSSDSFNSVGVDEAGSLDTAHQNLRRLKPSCTTETCP